ncbi:protein-methionine-sulfoxide reductase heme-binding subunit MsrQ [Photobacterium sanctipauli]|uniref:Protein-methionine-sulfoxide reductase heme-binding subunit MsrQ n=1 Tax=Photobacterium sanctipauli TaxID=1342794 RepID=A0A2T3NN37_9GAMM|nr:protein-methionine-sulfoxide reductase heme-binding subunit MsrQ [Photobacterium sanctipauli]PSW16899.1 protein-methionine-sulfoxide reductase heme-binding subunit MsrQ [Photobacterium sanctipauli]
MAKTRFKITPRHIFWLKVVIHLVSLGFLALLVLQTLSGGLGADPIQGISHFTGKAALNTLMITLIISPLARHFKQGMLVRVRRLVGLYSFFWALLHMMGYMVLDLNLNLALLVSEIVERPYLTLGAISWLILFALAVTSTQAIQRKMGPRWQQLHNWVYLAVLLAPIHYYWSVKSGIIEPAIYITCVVGILALRHQTFRRWLQIIPLPRRATEKGNS